VESPEDFARLELEAALDYAVRVIPVPVQGVEIPGSDRSPDALETLAHRHAVAISATRWNHDVGRLATALEGIIDSLAGQQARRKWGGEEARGTSRLTGPGRARRTERSAAARAG